MAALRRVARLAFLVLLPIAASTRPAEACSCASAPLCESFWTTPVVFSGLVLDVTPSSGHSTGSMIGRNVRVQVQVDQAWRGQVSGVIELYTGSGGGDCGYVFQRGERYLVYAYDRAGRLFASICGRTRRIADAAEDLAYFRTAFLPSVQGRIFGSVTYQRSSQPRPVVGYRVVLRGPDREWTTTTSADGRYEFRVPAGKYRIDVEVPPTERAYGRRDIELKDPRGCTAEDFTVGADGRIAMRVVGGDGRPAAGLSIEFVKLDTLTADRFPEVRRARVGTDGRVEVRELDPDRYVVGVNVSRPPDPKQPYPRIFYPGVTDHAAGRVVDLAAGERIELDTFVLPGRLAEWNVSGIVRWPDGTAAPGATVGLSTARANRRFGMPVGEAATSGHDGRFAIKGLAGTRYQLFAFVDVRNSDGSTSQWASSPNFEAGKEGGAITLTLAPPPGR